MDFVIGTLVMALGLFIGAAIGNQQGDQATLRDCATKGEAKMVGGGTIECTVKKEPK